MKTQRLNLALRGAATTVCLLGAAAPVWAEGSQSFGSDAHGVNRVIRTAGDPFDANSPIGYIGAKGDMSINFSMPTDAEGLFTAQTNPHDDKPSAYLGAQGPNASGEALVKSMPDFSSRRGFILTSTRMALLGVPFAWMGAIRVSGK